MTIQVPQTAFRDFTDKHPLLVATLKRWGRMGFRHFPEDPEDYYPRDRTAEQFVERYITDFLIKPPATIERGNALMGNWAKFLSTQERHQIQRLFGVTFKIDVKEPSHWYTDPKEEYLVLQEEVLEIYGNNSIAFNAVKTRNSYNAEVLNCTSMLIVDVDIEENGTDKCVVAADEKMALDQLKRVSKHQGYRWRIYRTAAGLRYIEVSKPWSAWSEETRRIMGLLYADPLYTSLCRRQETFRARLTPKPWRSGLIYAGDDELTDYTDISGDHSDDEAVCEFIGVVGSKVITSQFKPLIEVHDSITKALPKHRIKDARYILT